MQSSTGVVHDSSEKNSIPFNLILTRNYIFLMLLMKFERTISNKGIETSSVSINDFFNDILQL